MGANLSFVIISRKLFLWLKCEGVVSAFDTANSAFGNSTLCGIGLILNIPINTKHISLMQYCPSFYSNCIPQVRQEWGHVHVRTYGDPHGRTFFKTSKCGFASRVSQFTSSKSTETLLVVHRKQSNPFVDLV